MHSRLERHPMDILLVEDNPGDVRLTQEGLEESRICNRLHVVEDGVEALAFLRRSGRYANVPRPNLIMLDLNLPRKDGRELLADIKADEDLRRIPVVVLTSSDANEDINRAYDLYANCYITKPVVFERFVTIIKSIEDFWFGTVRLPNE